MSKSLKKLTNFNTKVSNIIDGKINLATQSYNKLLNKNVSYGINVFIIVLLVCIYYIPNNILNILNNTLVRLCLITMICILCLVDPIKALLLSIGFVLAIKARERESGKVT